MVDTTVNKEELKSLIQKELPVAAFIGAGCSAALNIPMWIELLMELSSRFGPYSTKEELLEAIKKDDYPLVASRIEGQVTDKTHYKDVLKKFTKPRSCHFTSLHLELAHLTKTIITTNYDKSFEEALSCLQRINNNDSFSYVTSTIGDFRHIGLGTKRHIYHIHGDNEDGNLVLTYESYKGIYENEASGLADLIRTIFREFSVVFVGFSFSDNFFVSFLQNTLKRVKEYLETLNISTLPTHYVIVSDSIFKDFFFPNELTEKGIAVSELIDASILSLKTNGALKDSVFYFQDNAENIIAKSSLDDNVKSLLLSQIELNKSNKSKLDLFDTLSIKPIVFEGTNYLQIEYIIREINAKDNLVSSSFSPNANK